MKKFIATVAAGITTLALAATPVLAQAGGAAAGGGGLGICPKGTGSNLCALTIPGIVIGAVQLILVIAFLLAFVFLVLGGIKWIMSGGDKAATESAKGTITAALVGLIVVLVAWALLNFVTSFFNLGGLNINQLNQPGV